MGVKPKERDATAMAAVRSVTKQDGFFKNPAEGIYHVARDAWLEGYYCGLTEAAKCERPLEVAEMVEEAADLVKAARSEG